MKKYSLIMLILVTALSTAACSKNEPRAIESTSAPSEIQPSSNSITTMTSEVLQNRKTIDGLVGSVDNLFPILRINGNELVLGESTDQTVLSLFGNQGQIKEEVIDGISVKRIEYKEGILDSENVFKISCVDVDGQMIVYDVSIRYPADNSKAIYSFDDVPQYAAKHDVINSLGEENYHEDDNYSQIYEENGKVIYVDFNREDCDTDIKSATVRISGNGVKGVQKILMEKQNPKSDLNLDELQFNMLDATSYETYMHKAFEPSGYEPYTNISFAITVPETMDNPWQSDKRPIVSITASGDVHSCEPISLYTQNDWMINLDDSTRDTIYFNRRIQGAFSLSDLTVSVEYDGISRTWSDLQLTDENLHDIVGAMLKTNSGYFFINDTSVRKGSGISNDSCYQFYTAKFEAVNMGDDGEAKCLRNIDGTFHVYTRDGNLLSDVMGCEEYIDIDSDNSVHFGIIHEKDRLGDIEAFEKMEELGLKLVYEDSNNQIQEFYVK